MNPPDNVSAVDLHHFSVTGHLHIKLYSHLIFEYVNTFKTLRFTPRSRQIYLAAASRAVEFKDVFGSLTWEISDIILVIFTLSGCSICFINSMAYNYLDLKHSLTWGPADVDHITNDVLRVLIRLHPGHLDGGGREGLGLHVGGHTRQPVSPEHREAGVSLFVANAVLSDTLVDSFVVLANSSYRQCAVGAGEKKRWNRKEGKQRGEKKRITWVNNQNVQRLKVNSAGEQLLIIGKCHSTVFSKYTKAITKTLMFNK